MDMLEFIGHLKTLTDDELIELVWISDMLLSEEINIVLDELKQRGLEDRLYET